MEYQLITYCEDCTTQDRLKDKYAIHKFEALSEAIEHYIQYHHNIKIELESIYDEE